MRYPYDDYLERSRVAIEEAPDEVFISRKVRRARKRHSCNDCGGAINIGDVHCYETWKVEGDIVQIRRHDENGGCYAYEDDREWDEDGR